MNKLEIGTTVNIQDKKSLFLGKTGIISGFLGRDVMITILVDGEERTVLASAKSLEVINTL